MERKKRAPRSRTLNFRGLTDEEIDMAADIYLEVLVAPNEDGLSHAEQADIAIDAATAFWQRIDARREKE